MNKRSCGDSLFSDTYDRLFFLSLLSEAVRENLLEVHAYCLMGNHYHLLVRTPLPTLDSAMHLVGSKYARHFNDRLERDGSLCRGRYRAILIDSESYLLAVSRYIHRNPLVFGLADLSAYSWSSYPSYLGIRPPQEWLTLKETLSLASGPARYESLVESPLPSEVDVRYERKHLPAILGSPSFRASALAKGA